MGRLSKTKGAQKEEEAMHYLRAQGISVLTLNFRCRRGEIDLIGEQKADAPSFLNSRQSTANSEKRTSFLHRLLKTPLPPNNPVLIFFEVKFRENEHFGATLETLSQAQQLRIRHCAEQFLHQNPQFCNHDVRFDVLAFTGTNSSPEWIQNAF